MLILASLLSPVNHTPASACNFTNRYPNGAVIATGAIDADAIADNAIDAGAIAASAIGASEIAIGAIDADAIASDAITAAKIAADAITSSELAASAVTEISNAILYTALTETYASDGSTGTLAQLLYEIVQFHNERNIGSTTITVKKRDGSTTAYSLTLNDATSPTSISRSG